MTPPLSRLLRRLTAATAAGALAAGGLALTTAPAQAAPATTTGSGPVAVDDATFTWGLSGYAQKGIFGPWNITDLAGDAELLTGSVSGGSQTSYVVAPVPATSMPASNPQKTPNAVRFDGGDGRVDPATGAGTLTWEGSYTVNAYPASFNAPDEIYSDPQLAVAANGSGTLTMDFSIGEGVDQAGNPFEEKDFGRITLATFDAGSLTAQSDGGYRVTPDYQGVEVTIPDTEQTRDCTTAGGATGWWGAWPQDFITALGSHPSGRSVLPHFYSSGCAGNQDLKPPLPIDVTYTAELPTVTVSETAVDADGVATVTVTGENFDPALATGTRPPLAGRPSGTYVSFAKVADTWRPSEKAPSSSRVAVREDTKWAVPAADMATIGGPAAGAVELTADGSFSTELRIDKPGVDALATASTLVDYGVITYAGGGATTAAYETFTPITFADPDPEPAAATIAVSAMNGTSQYGSARSATVTVRGAAGTPSGTVTATIGETTVGEGTLEDGTVTFPVSREIAVGKHTVRFAYSGDDAYAASTFDRALTIVKAQVVVAYKTQTKPTKTKPGKGIVSITPRWGGSEAYGLVRTYFRKGNTIKEIDTQVTRHAYTYVPRLSKGTWTVYTKYFGNNSRHNPTPIEKKGTITVK
jgi:hypothetical protein